MLSHMVTRYLLRRPMHCEADRSKEIPAAMSDSLDDFQGGKERRGKR
jgi:hypothetical protein